MFTNANAFTTIFNHGGHKHIAPSLTRFLTPPPPPPFERARFSNLQCPRGSSDKQFTDSKTFAKTSQLWSPRGPSPPSRKVFSIRWYGSSICFSRPNAPSVEVSNGFSFPDSELDALFSVASRKSDKSSFMEDHVESASSEVELEALVVWGTSCWRESDVLEGSFSFLVKGMRTRNSWRWMG